MRNTGLGYLTIVIPCSTEACMQDYHLTLGSGKASVIRLARCSHLHAFTFVVSFLNDSQQTCGYTLNLNRGSIQLVGFASGLIILQILGCLLASRRCQSLSMSCHPMLGKSRFGVELFWGRIWVLVLGELNPSQDLDHVSWTSSRFPHGRPSHPLIEAS